MEPTPTDDDMLAELASLGMRAARAVTAMLEVEARAVELAGSWLPPPNQVYETFVDAGAAGSALDLANDIKVRGAPRAVQLAHALDRLARCVRRTLALRRRLASGWTGTRADTRPAMLRRQLARRVGDAIRHQHGDTEAAERLFDDLALRLRDPALDADLLATPIDQIVHRLRRELNLALPKRGSLSPCGRGPGRGVPPRTQPDTG